MSKFKIIKNSALGFFVSAGMFVVVAFLFITPVHAMLWQENCYTSGYYSLPHCNCTSYTCYRAGSEEWNGNYMPSDGVVTRLGEYCTNGSGWSTNIGEWGDRSYCFDGSR